jgi:hypothetical protein
MEDLCGEGRVEQEVSWCWGSVAWEKFSFVLDRSGTVVGCVVDAFQCGGLYE